MHFNQISVYVYCCYFSEKSNKEIRFGSIVQTIVDKMLWKYIFFYVIFSLPIINCFFIELE